VSHRNLHAHQFEQSACQSGSRFNPLIKIRKKMACGNILDANNAICIYKR
jgi:hypothetical protein